MLSWLARFAWVIPLWVVVMNMPILFRRRHFLQPLTEEMIAASQEDDRSIATSETLVGVRFPTSSCVANKAKEFNLAVVLESPSWSGGGVATLNTTTLIIELQTTKPVRLREKDDPAGEALSTEAIFQVINETSMLVRTEVNRGSHVGVIFPLYAGSESPTSGTVRVKVAIDDPVVKTSLSPPWIIGDLVIEYEP